MLGWIFSAGGIVVLVVAIGLFFMLIKCYRKVEQGSAIIRNGFGGTRAFFGGCLVFPVLHRMEILDISVKRIGIDRADENGLICNDNMRADVQVAFFVRVNKTEQDVLKVAQSLGCKRASDVKALVDFFDAKFSEALKTVGKQFNFIDLYTNRQAFKEEILKVIGTDLNGYNLDDAAIDYLEQTNLLKLDASNILDAEGIKKITDLTAKQAILSNDITRDKEKIIKRQDVEAREAILELERQLAEAEQKQQREVAEITAREKAQALKVQQEEKLKAERARIITEEEVAVAEENKNRQIIVAQKNKQRTDVVETERVEKDRQLELTERERIVALAVIDKDKAVETEKKNIQEVIRDRVAMERSVVEEEEKIKDTREIAEADRHKVVATTKASEDAEQEKIKLTVSAEASKEASSKMAEENVILAEGRRAAAEKDSDAKKMLADATAAETAASGMGEAQVIEAKAEANRKQGMAEAEVMERKYHSEAQGIDEKAAAMKLFDAVGKEHEEFKLTLNKELEVELAGINIQKDIAAEQAKVVGEALKQANIDIVGGDATFFDKIISSITAGKAIDRTVDNSKTLTAIKETLFTGDSETFTKELKRFTGQFGIGSEDLKNLSISALLTQMMTKNNDQATASLLTQLAGAAREFGIGDKLASTFIK